MQQKIEENRRENFENDTCIPSIALGAASYFFIKQGKAQGVGGLTLRMVAETLMGTFTEDLYVPIFKGRVKSMKDISVFI